MGTLIRDGVKIGGTTVYVDSNLSTTSENPVENKIVTSALNEKANTSSLANVATTGSYNDLTNKPEIDTNLSTESTNAVQNKVITNSLDEKYPIDYDVALSLAEWEALGDEKYYNHKNYYIYDAGSPTEKPIVYGWHVDPNESDPSSAITYIKEAVGMTPASMGATTFDYGSWQNAFFMPKPCMVKENGEVDYYLNPDDYTKKKDNVTITSSPVDELPLSFNSNDDGVINYHIYGTTGGAGVKTENLWGSDDYWDKGHPFINNSNIFGYAYIVSPGTYTISTNVIDNVDTSIASVFAIAATPNQDPSISSSNNGVFVNRPQTVTVSENQALWIMIRVAVSPPQDYLIWNKETFSNYWIMFTEGSTVPTTYIPYGYQIPIINTSGVTENLVDVGEEWYKQNVNMSVTVIDSQTNKIEVNGIWYVYQIMDVEPNTDYYFKFTVESLTVYGRTSVYGWIGATIENVLSPQSGASRSFNTSSYEKIALLYYSGNGTEGTTVFSNISLTKGSTAPDHYIPHRYETSYNLYIGDTKLGAEEYLDYAEQKVYKRTENLFDKDNDIEPYCLNSETGVFTPTGSTSRTAVIPCTENTDYTFAAFSRSCRIAFFSSKPNDGMQPLSFYTNYRTSFQSHNDTVTSPTGATYIAYNVYIASEEGSQYTIDEIFSSVMIVQGSTAPSSYIPYIQPTDPPIPFPTINTYIGENTLSSTETLGKISIYAMSDITNLNYNGNAMMEWPLIFWKYEPGNIDGEGNFYISNRKIDNTYNCWCNYNSKNNIISNFYTAIYNGGIYNGKLRSMSGYKLITKTSTNYSNTSTYAINDKVLYNSNMYICITAIETPEDFDNTKWVQIPINGGTTATQEINSAIANNTTSDVEWYIDTWSDRMLINGLLILMGKSLNSQAIFGRGLDAGGQTAKEAYITGTLNNKGLFWGDTSTGTSGVKIFGMENWYSCAYRRTAGLIGLANGNTAYKMTYGTADGTTANGYNTTGDNYHINTVARPSSNYVKSCKFGDFGYLPLSTTGGSTSTYYADYWFTNNSSLTFALVGGSSNSGESGGISYFYLSAAAGGSSWYIAASLTLKPLIG